MAIKVIHCENTTVLLTTIDSSRKKHRKILRQLLLLNSTVVVFMQKLFIAIGLGFLFGIVRLDKFKA